MLYESKNFISFKRLSSSRASDIWYSFIFVAESVKTSINHSMMLDWKKEYKNNYNLRWNEMLFMMELHVRALNTKF